MLTGHLMLFWVFRNKIAIKGCWNEQEAPQIQHITVATTQPSHVAPSTILTDKRVCCYHFAATMVNLHERVRHQQREKRSSYYEDSLGWIFNSDMWQGDDKVL